MPIHDNYNLNDYDFGSEPPTFFETLQSAKDAGLVGEEDTVLTVVLSIIRGGLVIMTGPSRAGKDEVVDAAEHVFPSEQMIYRWPVDDSATAAFYKAEEINEFPVHRFPDLARLEEHHEKILKAFGEGRDAERDRTDIMQEQMTGEGIRNQVIRCPRTVIAFIATDNENVDLDDYPELRNRGLVVSVDASEGQTKAVNRRKAEERAGVAVERVDPIRRAEIKEYHASIPVDEWINTRNNRILNPASINIHEQEPIPEKFPEARQDFDRLLEFMETVALYNYQKRMVVERENGRVLLVAPEDVWTAMTILGNKMIMSALNLTEEDRAILWLLDDASGSLSKADVQQSLRGQGYNISDRDVQRSLKSMREKGYVTEHQGSPNTYSVSEFAAVAKHDVGIDYDEVARAAGETVYELVDDERAGVYNEVFCEGDALLSVNPFTGQAVDITTDNTLEEMMEVGVQTMDEIINEDREPDTNNQDLSMAQQELGPR